MKVSSPVGEFPFEARSLRVRNGRLVLEGSMGAWPARVEMEPADALHLIRLIPVPVLLVAGAALLGFLGRRTGRKRA